MADNEGFDFSGQRVLVTGAASGIGLAVAKAFAARGGDLILADIEIETLKREAIKLGKNIEFYHYDQSDLSSIENLTAALGAVDVFCNNAGIIEVGPFLEQPPQIIQKIIATNLTGPLLLAQQVGAMMVDRGKGVIINTASQLAFHGSATRAVYAAAKAGLVQFTKSAAAEWAPYGVRVVALAPGRTLTPMTKPFLSSDKERTIGLKQIPAGRYGTSEEMAELTVFLASDTASYIVGETLVADGGYVLL